MSVYHGEKGTEHFPSYLALPQAPSSCERLALAIQKFNPWDKKIYKSRRLAEGEKKDHRSSTNLCKCAELMPGSSWEKEGSGPFVTLVLANVFDT